MTSDVKIENNLFNDKKMEEFIHIYDDELKINANCDPVSYWIEKLEQDELKSEKANYIKFFRVILEYILGYKFTDIQYEENIGDEGRPVEFTLKKDGKDYVVVELKGTNCKDLNRRYNREQSPIEQVTNYASIKEETQWAFVSNYNEFRFFNPSYREKYISFKFKQLTDPNVLKKFLLIFSKFSLIDKDIPQILLKETKIIERELEDEFYKLFSETRLMLIKELEHSSEDIDRIEAIRLAQLILNRYIFLCFAEDLRLIPSETTADVLLTPIKHRNLFEFTMWDRLNELFRFADRGNEDRGIGAFNGGLFKESLRHLEIRDKIEDLSFFNDCYKTWKFKEKYEEIESLLGVYKDTLNPIYKNLLLISSFDFGSELSVNILGHIFENSIGDIEELKDETTERRKKDGVFYTPEYITDYICRNTIIPYLSISGEANTVHELISEYEKETDGLDELDHKLKEVKIIDISCGSGAFLNKAVDILFEIHEALHDSKYGSDETLNRFIDNLDKRKQIISNNIYGVDVNEESVEITKLSLFLKLATSTRVKQGFKLPNLNKNIKCGNSLIDDEVIVGTKAFNWGTEFNEVFIKGGFDIVIGNPPYIKADLQDEFYQNQRAWLWNSNDYETLYERWDYYIAFLEKGLKILNKNGLLSFIISNTYITSKSSKKSKEFIFDNYSFRQLDFFKNMMIFVDAGVESLILTIENSNKDKPCKRILHEDSFNNISLLKENEDIFQIEETIDFKTKFKNTSLLGDICYINYGMAVNADEKKAKGEFKKKDLISDTKNEINCKEYVEGKYLKPYKIEEIKYLEWNTDRVPNKIRRPTFRELYEFPKLIRGTTTGAIFDDDQLLCNHSCSVIVQYHYLHDVENRSINNSIKKWTYKTRDELELNSKKFDINYILAILNSKFAFSYLNSIRKHRIINYFYPDDLKKLPIKEISMDKQKELSNLAISISKYNKKLYVEIKSFKKWLFRNYNLDKFSKKLENYYELDFEDFLKEIMKKTKIPQRKQQELLENEFSESVNLIKPLQKEIQELESKTNQLVYELYGLTSEDIVIIENSFEV